jgi:YVTN family beta-propeller protein
MFKLTSFSAWLLCGAMAANGTMAAADMPSGQAASYAVVEQWALPGDGGWDYLTVNPAAHRVYLSRATHVAVVDTTTGKTLADIDDTPGVHGIALATDLGRGFISAGKADEVKVFDLATNQVTASVAVGTKPDAILYDHHSRRVFVFNGHSDSASVIDAATTKVVATLALGGGPEFARSDEAGHVYVNLQDKNELVAIDADALKVTGRWPLAGCDGPTGLALDAEHHRSFSVCANAAMTILDTQTGRLIATLPIGHGVDGADFDAASANAFSANGDGTLTVVHELDPDHFAVTQTASTAKGARTIAFDAALHRLYLPTASFGPVETTLLDAQPKPPILPDSFVVLVVAQALASQLPAKP